QTAVIMHLEHRRAARSGLVQRVEHDAVLAGVALAGAAATVILAVVRRSRYCEHRTQRECRRDGQKCLGVTHGRSLSNLGAPQKRRGLTPTIRRAASVGLVASQVVYR